MLYDPPVVQQRLKREALINRAARGILEGRNGLPHRYQTGLKRESDFIVKV